MDTFFLLAKWILSLEEYVLVYIPVKPLLPLRLKGSNKTKAILPLSPSLSQTQAAAHAALGFLLTK